MGVAIRARRINLVNATSRLVGLWPEGDLRKCRCHVHSWAWTAAIGPADAAPLRAQGLIDLEILDLTHAVAMFARANRLMQTLGEPVTPGELSA